MVIELQGAEAMKRNSFRVFSIWLSVVSCIVCAPGILASEASVAMHKNFPNVNNCVACHADPHAGQMGADCATCHNTDQWSAINSSYIHSTEFPLTGQHKTVSCEECHINGQFKGTPSKCQVCHWQRRQDDPYQTKLGVECARCHTPKGWAPANWNHTVETGFDLSGSHRAIACDQCHKDLKFKGTSAACISCHESDYNGAKDPDHKAGGYSRDCSLCHTASSWNTSSFNHATSGFSLTGGHAGLSCSDCHVGGVYTGLSTECFSCHSDDFQASRNPNHRAAGFSTDCTRCHDVTTWSAGRFDHAATGYALTGAHQSVSCNQCHADGKYAGRSRECYACHADDYASTSAPNHQASGYGTDCAACHTTSTWQAGSFSHPQFDLTGAHSGLNCSACHGNGQYAGTPRECSGCHLDDYQATRDPHHGAAGFTTSCESCHDTTTWTTGRYDHAVTGYPLTGKHNGLSCRQCHSSGVYKGLDTACYSCHADDYKTASDPNHVAAGLPSNCTTCHDTSGWQNDFFNHTTTGYTLTGAHTALDCGDCHAGDRYKGTPRDCFACHEEDYRQADGHAGYPTDCQQCHTTTSWQTTMLRQPVRNQRIRKLAR